MEELFMRVGGCYPLGVDILTWIMMIGTVAFVATLVYFMCFAGGQDYGNRKLPPEWYSKIFRWLDRHSYKFWILLIVYFWFAFYFSFFYESHSADWLNDYFPR